MSTPADAPPLVNRITLTTATSSPSLRPTAPTTSSHQPTRIQWPSSRPIPRYSSTFPTPPSTTKPIRSQRRPTPSQPPYSAIHIHHRTGFTSRAHVDPDGRVHISMDRRPRGRRRSSAGPVAEDNKNDIVTTGPPAAREGIQQSSGVEQQEYKHPLASNLLKNIQNRQAPVLASPPPRLNIVIMVIGSRGDIQPFLKLAKELVGGWGHRVRVATHPEFKEMVEDEVNAPYEQDPSPSSSGSDSSEEAKGNGIHRPKGVPGGQGEFFSIGGDPQELMAFMVKNPGLFPSLETIKTGEVIRRREQMAVMFDGFWRACIEPMRDPITPDGIGGEEAGGDGYGDGHNAEGMGPEGEEKQTEASQISNPSLTHHRKRKKQAFHRVPGTTPFIADAIIANPPSFAHIHIAEKLGIPLHLMFTFPYTPTTTMPHPLANISQSNVEQAYTNLVSYTMVEMMTWQGLGDLVNHFRKDTLGLEPISTLWAPGLVARLKVPTTYLWSPSLIPKPADWGPHIDISGFVFLSKASTFEPPEGLERFLDDGGSENPPIYIGFGSIVVDDPDSLTKMIFEAVKETGVRALVAKGWGGLGAEAMETPEGVYMLENTPHDWLFPRCRAVIHHGGAGTTAIGLKCGKPTFIVSFFGDQPFWGQMLKNAGAGDWCPYKELGLENLVRGIKTVIKKDVADKARVLREKIELEGDGARNAVMSFYRALERVGVSRMVGERGVQHSEDVVVVEEGNMGEGEEGGECETGPVVNGGAEGMDVGLVNMTAAVAAREGENDEDDVFGMQENREEAFPICTAVTHSGALSPTNAYRTHSANHDFLTPPQSTSTVSLKPPRVPQIPKGDDSEKELLYAAGIRCTILPNLVAVWRVRRTQIKLSALAAHILVSEGKFTWKDLRLMRHTEWNDFDGPGEPLSGGAGAIFGAVGNVVKGIFGVPYTLLKGAKRAGEDGIEYVKQAGETEGEVRAGGREGNIVVKATGLEGVKPPSTATNDTNSNRIYLTDGMTDEELHAAHEPEDSISHDLVHGTGHSIKTILRATLRAPMELTLAITQGFHNAPRLYGDNVRRPTRITGIHSGLRAAGKELTLGLYDSTTGLFTKPYKGVRKDGVPGFLKGVGKGLGGVFFRTGAGTFGLFGYTLKGIHKELHKSRDRRVEERIRAMRIWQGEIEFEEVRRSKIIAGGVGDVGQEEGIPMLAVVRAEVLKGWEREEVKEFEKKEKEAELKREMSGVREIGVGAAKLRQLKKREKRRVKKMKRQEEEGGCRERWG